MGLTRRMSVEVDELAAREMDDAVSRGDYASTDGIIEEALAIWTSTLPHNIQRMRRLVDEALADEDGWIEGNIDAEDIHHRGMERLARKRAARN